MWNALLVFVVCVVWEAAIVYQTRAVQHHEHTLAGYARLIWITGALALLSIFGIKMVVEDGTLWTPAAWVVGSMVGAGVGAWLTRSRKNKSPGQ